MRQDLSDPFHSTTLNDIMKPIIAMDRLKVLRRQYEHYDIALFETDLKVANFSKEKKL